MTNQTPQTLSASGLGAVLSIVQAAVTLVPRWLVVATGLVFLTWLGFDLYLNARQKMAQTEQIEAESHAKTEPGINAIGGPRKTDFMGNPIEEKSPRQRAREKVK